MVFYCREILMCGFLQAMVHHPLLVMPLKTRALSLKHYGGKARGLAALACAGLPVPDGFLISTGAYKDFLRYNALQADILERAVSVRAESIESAQSAADTIRSMFTNGEFPETLASTLLSAYAALPDAPAVAVRSSATAEDLPGLSFAGQQASYLNIQGGDALLDAVRNCWASLWSAQAISYRAQMGIGSDDLAMGVVVQIMLDPEVAGVAFSAHPVTGERGQLVINASFGLGEAVVSGRVTPDTFTLQRDGFKVLEADIGDKTERVVASGQGVDYQNVNVAQRQKRCLSDAQLGALGTLILQAEAVFEGTPQDVEWALVRDRFWLLQSRAITNLPAEPLADIRWDPPDATAKLVRRQVVENMPEPLSPLFEDLYLHKGLDVGLDELMTLVDMPFNVDTFIKRPLFVTVNGYGYCRYDPRISWSLVGLLPKILFWYVFKLPRLLKNLVSLWEETGLPDYLAVIERYRTIDENTASGEELVTGIRTLAHADARYWFYITMMVGAAKISEGMLDWFLGKRRFNGTLTSGMFLGGYPSKTLEAQDDLAAIAEMICQSPALNELVLACRPAAIVDELKLAAEGRSTVEALHAHLLAYGHQVYNLDFVEPTQSEQPLPVLLSLQAMVRRGARQEQLDSVSRAEARKQLAAKTAQSLGVVRRRLFLRLLSWAQRFGPYREQALFYMGAAWPVLRRLALEFGSRGVAAGLFSTPEDVFYLTDEELSGIDLSGNGRDQADFRALADERRQLREARKRLHPPARVPEDLRFKFGWFDMTRFFEVWETQKRNSGDAVELEGFAVSPGAVTGCAVVIHSLDDFIDMQPGGILVCPTTTPAWTPLFSQAAGLVTDIGGILAHGSIVAREYGIPAVLGTGNATQRIVTGQTITVDGTAGTVRLEASP
jgi:pyruvate,water dikinase